MSYPDKATIARVKDICAQAGVEFVGVQDVLAGTAAGPVVLFNCREVWGTIELGLSSFTVPRVKLAIERAKTQSRERKA